MNNATQSLLPSIIIENVIHFFGIFGNFNIILATIQSKALHTNCNLLIALQALFDLFGEFGGLVEVFTVYTANIAIDAYLCFFLQLIPAIGINMSSLTMLMIGIDRIIAIKNPIRYTHFNRIYYLIAMQTPGVLLNLAFVPASYFHISNKPTICTDGDIYPTLLAYEYVLLLVIIYSTAILVYVYMIYLVKSSICFIRCGMGLVDSASLQTTRKILKSIIIIVCVSICGWLIGVCYSLVAILLDNQTKSSYATSKYFINFTYLGMAASYYVYFYNSIDYRNAFRSVLGKMLCGCTLFIKQTIVVVPIVKNVAQRNNR